MHDFIDPLLRADKLNLYSASGFPNMIISPTENEANSMILPFAYPKAYMTITPRDFNPGSLYIYVLNPLTLDVNVPPVSVTVFANFVNVKLAGQITQAVVPPVAAARSQLGVASITGPELYYAQGKTTILDEAVGKQKSGILSTTLKAVSSAAGALTNVPIIGSWSAALSLVSGAVGAVAEKFGYCKPNTISLTEPRILRMPDFAASSGMDTGLKNQLIPENSVANFGHELGGKPNDMDILAVAGKPCLLSVVPWTQQEVDGTIIYSVQVNPMETFRGAAIGGISIFNTLLSYTSSMFRAWRGSIRYDVQITCSNFHSGRLRIAFHPGNEVTPSSRTHSNCINRVIDIQNETDFSFTIPYISDMPWSRVFTSHVDALNDRGMTGFLVFEVINELTHSSDPVPPVFINVWTSAGPDFQLAYPSTFVMTDRIVLPTPPVALTESEFVAQGLTSEEMMTREHPPLLPGASGCVENGICMVDSPTHFKQVLSRPTLFRSATYLTDASQRCTLGVNGTVLDADSFLDYYTWISSIYAFGRGSMNVKALVNTTRGDYKPIMRLSNIWSNDTIYASTNSDNSSGQQVFDQDYNPTNEVNCPYYGNFFGRVNGAISLPNTYRANDVYMGMVPGPTTSSIDPTLTATIYRSVGDDFNFHYIVGAPVIIRNI